MTFGMYWATVITFGHMVPRLSKEDWEYDSYLDYLEWIVFHFHSPHLLSIRNRYWYAF